MDRPFWGGDDPGMPLPFDLADIINRVESLLWRLALYVACYLGSILIVIHVKKKPPFVSEIS